MPGRQIPPLTKKLRLAYADVINIIAKAAEETFGEVQEGLPERGPYLRFSVRDAFGQKVLAELLWHDYTIVRSEDYRNLIDQALEAQGR